MVTRMTNGVKKLLETFTSVHYATATDGLATIPIYRMPSFDLNDKEAYTKLLSNANVAAVIWGAQTVNDNNNSPTGYIRILYACNLTIVSKSANQWDATNKLNRVEQGETSGPKKNSIPVFLMNFQGYLHQNRLNDGSGDVSFVQNVLTISEPIAFGDFISYTAEIEAKHMFSTTLSVTPV